MNAKDFLDVKRFVELFVETTDSDFVPYRELASYEFVGTDIHGADVFHVDFDEMVEFIQVNLPAKIIDEYNYNRASEGSEKETLAGRYLGEEDFRAACDYAAIEYCRVESPQGDEKNEPEITKRSPSQL